MVERRGPRLWSVGVGIIAAVLLVVGLAYVPRGPAEFAYFPFDLSWPWGLGRGWEVSELAAYAVGLVAGLPAVGFLAWGLAPVMPAKLVGRPAKWAVAITVASTALAAAGLVVINGRAIVPDELSYAEQARGFLQGLLLVPAPDSLFVEAFDIVNPDGLGLASKYLFGEALVQMPGVLVGLPGLLHIPLLTLACWAIWRAASLHVGEGVGVVILGMIALSPMLLWVSGTGLSHTPAFAAMALALLGEARAARGQSWTGAVLVGLGVAACGAIRPQVAVPIGGVLCLFTWWHLRRSKPAALIALVAIPVACGVLIAGYDWVVTGHPMRLPWSMTGEKWGFGTPIPGVEYYHGPIQALQNALTNGVRLSTWWLGWPTGLVFVALYFAVGRRLGGLRSWVIASAAQVVFMVGYFAPGIYDVGPIYSLEGLFGLGAVAGCGLAGLFDRRPKWALSLGLVWVVLAMPSTWLWAGTRVDRLLDQVHGPVQQMLAQVPPENSIVLVETDCTESLSEGSMLTSVAARRRTPGAARVIVPRPEPDALAEFLAFYGQRDCYYAHRPPMDRRVRVVPCERAGAWLDRPRFFSAGPGSCPRDRSFAEQLGWRVELRPGAPKKR